MIRWLSEPEDGRGVSIAPPLTDGYRGVGMNGWSVFWVIWGTVSLAVFAYGELSAVIDGRASDKLSQNLWRLQDALPFPTVCRVFLFACLVFIAIHLTFGPRH